MTTLSLRAAVFLLTCVLLAGTSRAQNQAPAPGAAPAAAPGRGGGGFGRRGGAPAPADQGSPRTDANSKLAHQQLLEKAKAGRNVTTTVAMSPRVRGMAPEKPKTTGIDIYFEGDSITRRWGTSDLAYAKYLANWNSNFFGWNAADFGWGADNIQNIIWRLENGELDNVNPKIIVILAGINNINGQLSDAGVTNIERGLKKIVDLCREKAPKAVIVLTAIFPRNDGRGNNALAAVPTIFRIDEDIAKFADGKKIRFLNVNDKLADKDGRQFPGMMNSDHLHPDTAGYQVWADGLKPIFTKILGPPAKTDHAPPPTGDPSAARPAANN